MTLEGSTFQWTPEYSIDPLEQELIFIFDPSEWGFDESSFDPLEWELKEGVHQSDVIDPPEQKPKRDPQRNIMLGDLGEAILIEAFERLKLDYTHNPTKRDENGEFITSVDGVVHSDERDDMVEVKNYPSHWVIDRGNFYSHVMSRYYSHEDENPEKNCTRNNVFFGVPKTDELVGLLQDSDSTAAFAPAIDENTDKNSTRELVEFVMDYIQPVVEHGNRNTSIFEFEDWLGRKKERTKIPVATNSTFYLYPPKLEGIWRIWGTGSTTDSTHTTENTTGSSDFGNFWRFEGG